jgi:hypothetical protein
MELVRNRTGTSFHKPDCRVIKQSGELPPWEWAKEFTAEQLADALDGLGLVNQVRPCGVCKPLGRLVLRKPQMELNDTPYPLGMTDGEAMDRLQAWISQPGGVSGADTISVVCQLMSRTGRSVLD